MNTEDGEIIHGNNQVERKEGKKLKGVREKFDIDNMFANIQNRPIQEQFGQLPNQIYEKVDAPIYVQGHPSRLNQATQQIFIDNAFCPDWTTKL